MVTPTPQLTQPGRPVSPQPSAPPVVRPVGDAVDSSASHGVDGGVGRDDPVPRGVVVVGAVDPGRVGVEAGLGAGQRPVAVDRRDGAAQAAAGLGGAGRDARWSCGARCGGDGGCGRCERGPFAFELVAGHPLGLVLAGGEGVGAHRRYDVHAGVVVDGGRQVPGDGDDLDAAVVVSEDLVDVVGGRRRPGLRVAPSTLTCSGWCRHRRGRRSAASEVSMNAYAPDAVAEVMRVW